MSLKLMSAISSPPIQINKRSIEAENLLKQLLECVQECQKRYGGKTELATEFDSCVAGLCLTLEAVFLHGLRHKPTHISDTNVSALKQVSDIFAQSLNINSDQPSFWSFVKKHLTKHEQERYTFLKHIWTDTGRGKAWLRSALNERSLERYCHTVLTDAKLLIEYYEPWAILRDDEKNSMLPNMAAGLGSILFAINIDKPELNKGVTTHRPEVFKPKAEPIIEAPVPANRERSKKKKKVARHLISFDDDDSALSTSIPSSSSSTASDSLSLGEASSSQIQSIRSNLNSEKSTKMDVANNESKKSTDDASKIRKLSIENSGSRNKFPATVPETLTPIAHCSEIIGELTPVSVEINTNFESPDTTSDDILEVPTDISALLTAVEDRNQEEITKREEKIKLLLKENEALKEQVKKYVGAIQMLNKDDDVTTLDDTLEQIENRNLVPNYRDEAKIFERKLVQVAEMHAELMDFNNMLQQSLYQKDALLERFKKELELLRGPMPSDELLMDEELSSVNVWMPSAFLTGTGSASHHVYQIFLRAGTDEWNIYRRYAQFHALHTDLKKLDPVIGTFDFPPKKSIGNKDSALVEDRRKRLQVYLRKILAHWPELAHCNSRFLLEQHLAFFKDQQEDVQNKRNMFTSSSRRQSGPSTNNYSGL